jgi:membrane protease YdiL (CAAX protease family)
VNYVTPAKGFWQGAAKDTALFSLIPLASLLFLKIRPGEAGLSLKNWKVSLKYASIMLILASPFMLYGASLPDFKVYYPIWHPARESALNLLLLEVVMAVLMFNTEFFFRGFLLFNLEKELGGGKAVMLHVIPYCLVHIGKPTLEVPYSLFAGLVFGYVALRTRSILPSFLAHWGGAWIFDLLCLR